MRDLKFWSTYTSYFCVLKNSIFKLLKPSETVCQGKKAQILDHEININKLGIRMGVGSQFVIHTNNYRVSVQGVKSIGGHFACLCRDFDFYEVKKNIIFSKTKGKYFYTFNHFYSEKSSKRAN